MAFRKRNIALSRAPADGDASPSAPSPVEAAPAPTPTGVRPSPIDGRPTTSTGTPSLDSILAGHAGLPLGNSILIEESGTTDYAGALLRFYAAEGVVQGHKVHVVGMGEVWGRELPGISEGKGDEKRRESKERAEKMKIAWRYEGLGQFESARGASCVSSQTQCYISKDLTPSDRTAEGADAERERRRSGVLPYIRLGQTANATCGHGDELHRNTTNDTVDIAAYGNTAECAAATCFDARAYNTPPRHTVPPLASVVSSNIVTSQFDTPVPARSSCVAAAESNTAYSHHHSTTFFISSLFRSCTLDGDPL